MVYDALNGTVRSDESVRNGSDWATETYAVEGDGTTQVVPYTDSDRFDWVVASSVPAAEFRQRGVDDARSTVAASFESALWTQTMMVDGEHLQAYRSLRLTDAEGREIVGVVATGYGLARYFARPIEQVRDHAQRLARGEFDEELDVDAGNDEIGEMVTAFEEMHGNPSVAAARADALADQEFDAPVLDEEARSAGCRAVDDAREHRGVRRGLRRGPRRGQGRP
jgi:methyl-accepting chemotaxis protein